MGNVFGKDRGARGVQPWAVPITVGKALRELYTSLGDVTLIGANTIATLLDGPEKVVRYGALTLGDGTTATSLTASNRCKGLTIICDSLTVKANATLNMTGRGARVMTGDDPFFPFLDFRIPNQIALSSDRVSLASALKCIRDNGFAPWDQGTWQALVANLFGFNLSVSQAGSLLLMSAAGCGNGADGLQVTQPTPGNTGAAGTSGGMGGGGSGGVNYSANPVCTQKAGKGCPYSGGSGSGGCYYSNWSIQYAFPLQSQYSGPGGKGGCWYSPTADHIDPNTKCNGYGGGGAGNPGGQGATTYGVQGGNGCGGKLVIICYGNVTVNSGGKIESNGSDGGAASNYGGGGGSGGGHVSLIYQGTYTNSGTVQAAGGIGGDPGSATTKGGSGGAGSVVTKTFIDMGWT